MKFKIDLKKIVYKIMPVMVGVLIGVSGRAIARVEFNLRQARVIHEVKALMGAGDSVRVDMIDENGTCGDHTLASGCFYRDDDDNGYVLIDAALREDTFRQVLIHELCHYQLRDE